MEDKSRYNFSEWPLDLLIDYVLKVHHRGVREKGPDTLNLISKVMMENLVLDEVEQLFSQSLSDLDTHLMKEERVLFPYILDLYEAVRHQQPIAPMHCGSVRNPISVMMSDHDAELPEIGLPEFVIYPVKNIVYRPGSETPWLQP